MLSRHFVTNVTHSANANGVLEETTVTVPETGVYVIDDNYRIVSFNDSGKQMYPKLELNTVCHQSLMGLDHPCPQCPVANKVQGPNTYLDPKRNIYVTVDSTTLLLPQLGTCHALTFTLENRQVNTSLADAYQRSTDLLEAFVSNLSSACVIDLDNNSFELIKTTDKVTPNADRCYSSYIEGFFGSMICEDSVAGLKYADPALVAERLKDCDGFSYDFELKDGTWWRLAWKSFAKLSGNTGKCLMLCTDITEDVRKRVVSKDAEQTQLYDQAELKELLEKAQTQLSLVSALCYSYLNAYVIDLDGGGVKVLKLDGYVTEGLETWRKEDDFRYQQILDKYVTNRVHPEDRETVLAALDPATILKAFEKDGDYSGHYRIVQDGDTHYYQFRYTQISGLGPNGHRLCVAGFQNIDTVAAEEAANRRAMADALAAAEHSNRAKTTFLNNMSHDIRTPMNAIIGFTSLAATHLDNKEQVASYLQKIQTSSRHLLSLINDVLDMSRIESGKMHIEEAEANLGHVMHDLKTIVQADITAKRLDFFIDTVDIENEQVICDKLRLNQILLNLLSNAVKFTEPGGYVSLRITQKPGAPQGFADYEFCVKDSGIGMSPEFIEHVFEAFEREHNSTVGGTQGTGLGMAITKNIVDMMGGTIGVESTVGKGSTFTVNLRFKTANNAEKVQPPKELEGLRALVVDDSLHTCTSVTKMLTQIGMRADWTTSGKEAVFRASFAAEQHDEYYAYIIDWLMPDMNGVECVRRIRAAIGNERPIIILTAYDWADIEHEAREAGVTAFCSKPLFMSDLRQLLEAPFVAAAHEEATGEPVRKPDFAGKRVLVVEDNALNREITAQVLESVDVKVCLAVNGADAVSEVEKHPAGYFGLVLMDVQMPIMNGYDATRCIRALEDQGKARTPIYAMTANTFDEDKQAAMAAGMDGHLAKPIEVPVLIQTLSEVLGE